MRKDAAARRERLIAVAAVLFERDGYDVPLETVIAAAGLGRGTLYRNFRDRGALMTAVLAYRLAELQAFVARHDDDATLLRTFLCRSGMFASRHAPAIATLKTDPSLKTEMLLLTDYSNGLLAQIVARSHAAGTLRREIGTAGMEIVAQMLVAAAASGSNAAADLPGIAVDILLRGLTPDEMLQTSDEIR